MRACGLTFRREMVIHAPARSRDELVQLIRDGTVRDGVARLDIAVVDVAGGIHEGVLHRGLLRGHAGLRPDVPARDGDSRAGEEPRRVGAGLRSRSNQSNAAGSTAPAASRRNPRR
jgi:hypothetical protein